MEEKKKGDPKTAPNTTTKVHNPNDLCKVLDYFRYTVGTTLDCFFATGILRLVCPGFGEHGLIASYLYCP